MVSGQITERLKVGWVAVSSGICGAALYCGTLIGALIVSTWLSWTLTWGDDRALACAAILMFAGGLVAGGRFSLSRYLGQSELAVAACTWTLLQPWLIAGLTLTMRHVPISMLDSEGPRILIGLICAIPTWFTAGWLWSSLAAGTLESTSARRWTRPALATSIAFGIAIGLAGNAFFLAPWIGAWGTIACAAVVVIAVKVIVSTDQPVESSDGNSFDNLLSAPSALDAGLTGIGSVAISSLAAVTIGGLFAVVLRLAGQLMPIGSQVYFAEWMGLAIGFGLGQFLRNRYRSVAVGGPWFMLVPAAGGGLLLIAMPAIVGASLWSTASLTWVVLLMTFRVLLLVAATVPVGFSLTGVMPVRGEPFGRWVFALPVAIGFVSAQFGFESVGVVGMLTVCCVTLVLLGLNSLRLPGCERPSWLGTCGIVGSSLFGLSVPMWHAHDNPSQTAKLLFSTPAFVAHRAGWESRLLTELDDARVIDLREGIHGPLTLWRSHGLELHLRENGIPRAIISADTESHPQFAPEVLQVVFPMLMTQHPNQVLLLGASGGVPLATCLQFPVHKVTCAEADSRLTEVIRGPIARETGYDPFTDERTQLVTAPPTLALMNGTETYDVILSSPASSSTVAGAAMFTVDHYQHASRRLAAGGIFCQRFQCVDYGPDPLRIVVQSMRNAFREVIAIETAAGEFLLLGTNTDGVFVPEDLPNRLSAVHVRRLLARSSLDWSALLNFPAYDHAALGEICAERWTWTNAPANGMLALRAPLELMRWAPKLKEVQQVLTAVRSSRAPFAPKTDETNAPAIEPNEPQLARKSRLLEWLGDRRVTPDLLRRLSEVATQHKLVQENPESHWWDYRKALREQLQKHSRSTVQQVGHSTDETPLHPDDERRKQYFIALGAAHQSEPTAERIEAIAAHLQPYDPLISYFARQEIADLQARGQIDPAAELASRLHVIYFAPGADASTRNVSTALELLVRHPEAVADPGRRFDILNGLVQTLRTRWESRQSYAVKSARRQISDVDRSVVAIEKAIQAMDGLHSEARVTDLEWENRKQVIDRILLRPLRTYHGQLQTAANRGERRIKAATDATGEDAPSIP